MSVGNADLIVTLRPFVDGALLPFDALKVGGIGGARLVGGGAVIGDGRCEGRPLMAQPLLEAGALLLPVAGLALLEDQHERQSGGYRQPSNALRPEEAEQQRHCPSASTQA